MDEKTILNNLKAVAARLSLAIHFKYLVLDWSEGLDEPIIKMFKSKPAWTTELDDYGFEYSGWNVGKDSSSWVGVINTTALFGTRLGSVSKDIDFSKMIISNEDKF